MLCMSPADRTLFVLKLKRYEKRDLTIFNRFYAASSFTTISSIVVVVIILVSINALKIIEMDIQ